MKTFSNIFIIVISASVGLAVGHAWKKGHVSKVSESATTNDSASVATRSNRFARKLAGTHADDSPLATQLEKDLATSSRVAKWFHWMSVLEKAQPADFPRLMKLARNNPAVRQFVINRWVETAPRNLFDTLVAASKSGSDDLPINDLGYTLFNSWAKTDPDAAIAALSEGQNVGMRDAWRMNVATAVMDKDPERGLALMSDWHIENYGPNMNAVEKWAALNPNHAAEFALAHPAGYASQETMETIGKVWAKTDPAAGLAFATSQPGMLGAILASSILNQWAGKSLSDASDWLAAADEPTRNRLSPAFVEAWAKQDAMAALTWSQQNLQGTELMGAVGGAIKGAAQKDVVAAAALVTAMDPSEARANAAAEVADKWFPRFDTTDAVKPEALVWLSGLDAQSIKKAVDQVSWTWATADPKSMAQFLSSASSDEVSPFVDSRLAQNMARNDPHGALDWAASLPESRALPAGSDAFAQWEQSQPDSAMEWFNNLPANDPRRQPFLEKMVQTLAWSSQTQQLSTLSDADQAAAQTIINKMGLPEDKRDRLLSSLKH